MGHNHRGLIRIPKILGRLQSRNDFCIVMSIDLENAPTEFFEYGLEVDVSPGIAPVSTVLFARSKQPAELLQAVPIENRGQIPELVPGSDMQGFPNHSFLEFAVTHHDKSMELLAPQPATQSESEPDR